MADLEQYIVKPGDSLYMIAKKYGVTVEELKQSNHLASNMIYPNQVLFIPKNKCKSCQMTTSHNQYDSVNDLINKYSYTLNEISNYKMPNQVVTARDVEYYIIQPGDTVEDILIKAQLSPIELLKYNEQKFIVPGEKIIIGK
jgi:LysM repeat protein